MKVSVIIPTYNRAYVLKRAIDSVLSQTFDDFELLVVDDGSTDMTSKLLAYYEGQPKVKIFKTENKGVSAARNFAFKNSSGSKIAFLDSDDVWEKDKLKKQIELFTKSPHLPLVHTEEIWIRNGKRVNPKKIHKKSGGDIFKRSLRLCLISPSAVMIKREILKEYGGFNEEFIVCEDYDLWLKITSKYEIGFIDKPLVIKYGGHEDQLSKKYKAMDYFRVKSMFDLFLNGDVSSQQKNILKEEMIYKSQILLQGHKKHQNFTNFDEIERIVDYISN